MEGVPVVVWDVYAGIFPDYLSEDTRYMIKHNKGGAYYLCSNNAWNVIDMDEANKHLERLFRDKGAIED